MIRMNYRRFLFFLIISFFFAEYILRISLNPFVFKSSTLKNEFESDNNQGREENIQSEKNNKETDENNKDNNKKDINDENKNIKDEHLEKIMDKQVEENNHQAENIKSDKNNQKKNENKKDNNNNENKNIENESIHFEENHKQADNKNQEKNSEETERNIKSDINNKETDQNKKDNNNNENKNIEDEHSDKIINNQIEENNQQAEIIKDNKEKDIKILGSEIIDNKPEHLEKIMDKQVEENNQQADENNNNNKDKDNSNENKDIKDENIHFEQNNQQADENDKDNHNENKNIEDENIHFDENHKQADNTNQEKNSQETEKDIKSDINNQETDENKKDNNNENKKIEDEHLEKIMDKQIEENNQQAEKDENNNKDKDSHNENKNIKDEHSDKIINNQIEENNQIDDNKNQDKNSQETGKNIKSDKNNQESELKKDTEKKDIKILGSIIINNKQEILSNKNNSQNVAKEVVKVLMYGGMNDNAYENINSSIFGFIGGISTKYLKDNISISTNENELETSDFIFVNSRKVDYQRLSKFAKNKTNKQVLILYSMESPLNQNVRPEYDQIFDLSLTYNSQSFFALKYGRVVQTNANSFVPSVYTEMCENKKNKATVGVLLNDCSQERIDLIKKFQTYFNVIVYGNCSRLFNQENVCLKENCLEDLKKVKFYLAFEKAICKDYLSDIFYQYTQQVDAIPIIYNGVNMSSVFPRKAYINMRDFYKLHDLMLFLKRIDDDCLEWTSYFKWKGEYKIESNGHFGWLFEFMKEYKYKTQLLLSFKQKQKPTYLFSKDVCTQYTNYLHNSNN